MRNDFDVEKLDVGLPGKRDGGAKSKPNPSKIGGMGHREHLSMDGLTRRSIFNTIDEFNCYFPSDFIISLATGLLP